MDKRFATFLAASCLLVAINFGFVFWLQKNQPAAPAKPPVAANNDAVAQQKKAKPQPKKAAEIAKRDDGQARDGDVQAGADDAQPAAKAQPRRGEQAADKAKARPEPPEQFRTLGSADSTQPYRMLVMVTSRGAAVQRIELNSPRFHDIEDRGGYIGHLEPIKAKHQPGCEVRVVGPGTPADRAGLKAGDVITALDGQAVVGAADLEQMIVSREPGDTVELQVVRNKKKQALTATLARRPLEVVKPERSDPKKDDPLSFLLTLESIGEQKIAEDDEELAGLRLRTGNWTVLDNNRQANEVSFEWVLEDEQLAIVKTYRLDPIPQGEEDAAAPAAPHYHLNLRVSIRNLGDNEQAVAYRLDGPTGLPLEGWWYAYSSKIGQGWSSPGIRDFVLGYLPNGHFNSVQVIASQIAGDAQPTIYSKERVVYAGVDAQYIACTLIPVAEKKKAAQPAEGAPADNQPAPVGGVEFAQVVPIRVGRVPADKSRTKLVDVSCRLISNVASLAPGGPPLTQDFQIFAGPKRPKLLANYAVPYGMHHLVYYGWFGWVSEPMLAILHFFYSIVGNYGLSIVMLTVLVRSCLFPISRKQAMNAAKMQELQPEIKRITEKHKGNTEQRAKAQQELFRKHNYNPLSGCLPAFMQLPIFLGLYRSLAVDVELRQAPLISESVRWCSNLGAPDMLWFWQPYLPDFLGGESGWLGPYLNVLPLVTIALFIVQQKMFMPPPTDEQQVMQQKMMKYMMIFMGVMFFKVASGLCLYFIASSLWGIAERKLLPKAAKATPPGGATGGGDDRPRPAPSSNGNGSPASRRQKQRDRK
jgi:YidC/Oxa1 family membrane protein insertase